MNRRLGNLFSNEFTKLYKNSVFKVTLISFFFLNILLIVIVDKTDSFSASAYCQLKTDCEGKEETDKLEYIKEQYIKSKVMLCYKSEEDDRKRNIESVRFSKEAAEKEGYTEQWYNEVIQEYTQGDYLVYTDSLESEVQFLGEVFKEVEPILNYSDYLKKVQREAEDNVSVTIFKNSNSDFTTKNLNKTAHDFAKLNGKNICFTGTIGFAKVMDSFIYDICPVLAIAIISMIVFMEDRRNGFFYLIRSTWNGYGALAIAKLMVLFLFSMLVTLLYWGFAFFYVWKVYGQIDLSASIQSIVGFSHCTAIETIGMYLVQFLLEKEIVLFFIALVFSMFLMLTNNYGMFFLTGGMLFGISYICYGVISRFSIFSIFRYCNILYMLNVLPLTRDYLNFNLFGYPVSHEKICWLLFFIAVLIILIINVIYYGKCSIGYKKIKFEFILKQWKEKKRAKVSIFFHESYKTFIGNKVVIILVFIALIMGYMMEHQETYLSKLEYDYQNYMKQLEGEVTQEKRDYITKEQDRIDKVNQQIQKVIQLYTDGTISESVKNTYVTLLQQEIGTQDAFELVKERLAYLDAHPNENLIFVYESGWNTLFGLSDQGYSRDMQNALICIFCIIGCLTNMVTIEYETGMYRLQHVYKRGRNSLFISKLFLCAEIILLLMCCIYLPDIIFACKKYGLHCFTAKARSIPLLENTKGSGGSILVYMIVLYTERFFTYLFVVLVMFGISKLTKSTIKTMLCLIILFAIPLILNLLGVNFVDRISLNIFFSGNQFLQGKI